MSATLPSWAWSRHEDLVGVLTEFPHNDPSPGRPRLGSPGVGERARWCRPRLVAKSDPDHDAISAGIGERVDALPAGSVVLAEDETHLYLLARVRSCWTPLDMRRRVMTPGSNVRRTVHGAVNLATGAFHHQLSG